MSKTKKIAAIFMLSAVLFFAISFYSIYKVNSKVVENQNKVQYNSYVGEYEISNTSKNDIYNKLSEIEDDLTSKDIKLIVNEKEYTYKLSDLGIEINKEEVRKEIIDNEANIDYWDMYNNYSKNEFNKIVYEYNYVINEEKLNEFIQNLKQEVDIKAKNGKLQMNKNRVLEYVGEVIGYDMNIEESIEVIKDNFKTLDYNTTIELVGKKVETNDKYKVLNTKISSFTTTFDDTVNRKYNLINGAKLIDGKIVQPGEVFSFFENAGPFTREGYVYYLGMKANGVCQVATTLYNAELLAGLTTVLRYNHGKKSVYVDGGLDATVAVTRGYVTDFKFKNTHKYPIYISAYTNGGKLTVEIWSNENAKEGIEYKTESKRIGYGSYAAYRHFYKDGKLIKTENLGKSYYFSE